jgi:hypothetical protein
MRQHFKLRCASGRPSLLIGPFRTWNLVAMLLLSLGSSVAMAQSWKYEVDSSAIQLPTDGTPFVLQFGRVDIGQTTSILFRATNISGGMLTFRASYPQGGAFSSDGPSTDTPVQSSAFVQFTLTFHPASPGLGTASMTVNNQTFGLNGTALLPKDRIAIQPTGTVSPSQQSIVRLTVTPPVSTALTGKLQLTFSPNNTTGTDDPATQFGIGGRTIPFMVPPNQIDAIFDGGVTTIGLQIGTVAGSITLAPLFFAGQDEVTPTIQPSVILPIDRAAPSIVAGSVERTSSGFNLLVTAFSTTREISRVTLQLNPALGASVSQNIIDLNQTNFNTHQAFAIYFGSQQSFIYGSLFVLTVPATYSGSLAAIQSITVTISNLVGSSQKTLTL